MSTTEVFLTVVPILIVYQLVEAIFIITSGILRGLGLQRTGGIITLFAFNVLAIPLGLLFAFVKNWNLIGLWSAMLIGVFTAAALQIVTVCRVNFARFIKI
jgi:MATE family multidrug resistance protein